MQIIVAQRSTSSDAHTLNLFVNDVEKRVVKSKNRFLLNLEQKLNFSDDSSFKKRGY